MDLTQLPELAADFEAVAILLAAGRSTRMGGPVQKSLLHVADEPVVLRSARALVGARSVRGLVVVTRAEERAAVEAALVPVAAHVLAFAVGGAERVDSVRAGVLAAPRSAAVLLVHDAARCLVRSARVEEGARAAARGGAALLAVRVRDTLKRSRDGHTVDETLVRSELWAAQTPQAARAELLRDALRRADEEHFMPTDDVALIERYSTAYGAARVALVEGDDDNLKLTSPADIALAEALLARRVVEQRPTRENSASRGNDAPRGGTER
jgi:2-C-methyl-D-erythritol 4-phosphate cytidylyltransferase